MLMSDVARARHARLAGAGFTWRSVSEVGGGRFEAVKRGVEFRQDVNATSPFGAQKSAVLYLGI